MMKTKYFFLISICTLLNVKLLAQCGCQPDGSLKAGSYFSTFPSGRILGNMIYGTGNDLNGGIIRGTTAGLEFLTFTSSQSWHSSMFVVDEKVGIGINSPQEKLDVGGSVRISNYNSGQPATWDNITIWSDGYRGYLQSNGDEEGLFIKSNTGNKVIFESNVGIGTDDPCDDCKLDVDGKIRSEEVKVEVVNAPDYVFEDDYELRTLKETKAYIEQNKHLPEIPAGRDMEADGVDLGVMNMKLLKKIEEMTLHQIELMERLEQLETKVNGIH